MNSSTLRRLAADHSSLHTAGLPPYYLFPSAEAASHMSDDLTKLAVLVTGSQGTPYSEGLWKLCLTIPHDYPKNPPRAAFRTRIWHPNVDEKTGHVCVDTLKRDWDPKLTLRDILITITCLLIHPNPDSALNASAGHLLQEDYETFARQAKLMTSIHARIPKTLQDVVLEAKRRGEESDIISRDRLNPQPLPNVKACKPSFVAGKRPDHLHITSSQRLRQMPYARAGQAEQLEENSDADTEDEASASKENDPSLSPSPVAVESPRISASTKRPLSDLPTPTEPEYAPGSLSGISSSEQNIPSNIPLAPPLGSTSDDLIETLKLVERNRSIKNHIGRALQDSTKDQPAFIPFDETTASSNDDNNAPAPKRICSREGKENGFAELGIREAATATFFTTARPVLTTTGNTLLVPPAATRLLPPTVSARKPIVNNNVTVGSSNRTTATARPRIGVRRL